MCTIFLVTCWTFYKSLLLRSPPIHIDRSFFLLEMTYSIAKVMAMFLVFSNLLFMTNGLISNRRTYFPQKPGFRIGSTFIRETASVGDSNAEVTSSEMTPIERIGRAISFYSAAIPVFASYKILEQKLKLLPIDMDEEEKEYQKIHEWGSEIMTEKIKELRGFYVKTGQIISTRVDIFPEQYTSKLAVTQDALDPVPAESIKEIVRNELLGGGDLSELFLEFEDEPLGSASVAQVRKTLKLADICPS